MSIEVIEIICVILVPVVTYLLYLFLFGLIHLRQRYLASKQSVAILKLFFVSKSVNTFVHLITILKSYCCYCAFLLNLFIFRKYISLQRQPERGKRFTHQNFYHLSYQKYFKTLYHLGLQQLYKTTLGTLSSKRVQGVPLTKYRCASSIGWLFPTTLLVLFVLGLHILDQLVSKC